MTPSAWDPQSYTRLAGSMEGFAAELLARVDLARDSVVLDAGCGPGSVTELLLDLTPDGRVIAVDNSSAMVQAARARLGDRAEVLEADLLELSLPQPVDAIFSMATFHWIMDHPALFRRLHAALRPGGLLIAQTGDEQNVARIRAAAARVGAEPAFAEQLDGWSGPWNFVSASATRERLADAGFGQIEVWTEERPYRPSQPRAYLVGMVLARYLDRLPSELHDRFVDRVIDELGPPLVIDYVRLNVLARA